ncbi:hypothetical protein B0H34DRAFT_679166 [Crassisporium funariophilum]|nr:hypothetical protein B0H34DRAFT_679166 [Crassisporium funariophilum]
MKRHIDVRELLLEEDRAWGRHLDMTRGKQRLFRDLTKLSVRCYVPQDDVVIQYCTNMNQHLDSENVQIALLAASKALINSTTSQLASSTAELTRLRPEVEFARESLVAAESN